MSEQGCARQRSANTSSACPHAHQGVPKLTRGLMIDLGDLMHCAEDAGLSTIQSGYTYLGQFIDHDMTRSEGADDPGPGICRYAPISNLVTPELDLSSVYAPGGLKHQQAANQKTGEMLLGRIEGDTPFSRGAHDLPRDANKYALIPDDRNDENLLIAQMHVQFLCLHNHFVEQIKRHSPTLDANALFDRAKAANQNAFLHIVYHDFLKVMLHPSIYALYFASPETLPFASDDIAAFRAHRFFTAQSSMPDEFRMAAFRYGHGMVRKTYIINHHFDDLKIDDLLHWTGELGLFGHAILPSDKVVDWRIFFDKQYTPNQSSKIIMPAVSINLPDAGLPGTNLASRNLLRHLETNLPDAFETRQHILAQAIPSEISLHLETLFNQIPNSVVNPKIGFKEDNFLNLPVGTYEGMLDYLAGGNVLKQHPPLWYYVLCEAYYEYGTHLGPLASLIIAETFYHLLPCSVDAFPASKVTSMIDLITITQSKEA